MVKRLPSDHFYYEDFDTYKTTVFKCSLKLQINPRLSVDSVRIFKKLLIMSISKMDFGFEITKIIWRENNKIYIKMYTLIDGLCTIGSLVMAVILPIYFDSVFVMIGIGFYFVYPLILEPIYNMLAYITYSDPDEMKRQQIVNRHNGLPIVYHHNYNITACGIEKMHPFDSCKYQRVYEDLIQSASIKENQILFCDGPCSRGLMLSLGIGKCYLLQLCYSYCIFRIVEVPICFLPGSFLRWRLLDPMLWATQGSILAAQLAIKKGWSINIGGGYHHASLQSGGGFCVYPDITLAVKYVRKFFSQKRVMIIDLDAHQGNGHERDFLNDPDTFIIDLYNHYIYPNDTYASQGVKYDVQVSHLDTDLLYVNKLKKSLSESIKVFEPEFVLYNAGTDCMANDPLGQMSLSQAGVVQRDEVVFEYCLRQKIPIMMILSGGYQRINAPTIAMSIKNLLNKFQLDQF